MNALAPERIIHEFGGRDSWPIVVGADVVIAAAAIEPDVRDVEPLGARPVHALKRRSGLVWDASLIDEIIAARARTH